MNNQKKNLYFVQPNSLLGNSVYFPYAVGVIATYSFQFDEIKENCNLGGFIYKEEPLEKALDFLKDPFFVAFSNYFWNYDYNLKLAKAIKEKYPECTIDFGGHQIPHDTSYLEKYDFIDILSYGEGEIVTYEMLKRLISGGNLSEVSNIAFRDNGKIVTTKTERLCVDDYPSPYLSGTFDSIIENNTDGLDFNVMLETNRGCPYHCAYCDWCDWDPHPTIRKFSMDKILGEIEWFAEHKIEYCMCVDANFGIFERDEDIIDAVIEAHKRTGFPVKFGASYAKNKTNVIFNINKKLNEYGMSKGVSLAFQSMSGEVLENIGRKNMSKEKLMEQLVMYHEAEIPTYTELILGLPGETYDSFSRGMCELLELGQHDCINVFRCEVYPNAAMSEKNYMEKYKIKTTPAVLNQNHCEIKESTFSGTLLLVGETSTLSSEELIDATLFAACVQCIHCHGLLQCFAIYLHNEKNVSYYDFYSDILKWVFTDESTFCNKVFTTTNKCMHEFAIGKVDLSYQSEKFGSITWPFEEAMFLTAVDGLDDFYDDVTTYLKKYGIDDEIFNELMIYQKSIIVTPGKKHDENNYSFDFYGYFSDALQSKKCSLKKENNTIILENEGIPDDPKEYARQIVWYGRRNRKAIYTSNSKFVKKITH